MKTRIPAITFILPLLLLLPGQATAQDWRELIDLSGKWKFEIGDDTKAADPAYNDSKWDVISVPSPWEDEGYPGYDGYAWYRKHFRFSRSDTRPVLARTVYLILGYIDDVSEVYLNGHLIGFAGRFPPDFYPGDGIEQHYPLLPEFVNLEGDNVIAVRVYDLRLAGGIIKGNVGLFEPEDELRPDYSLAGSWKVSLGDEEEWREPSFDDMSWQTIMVPGYLETQGHRDYDGFSWYRKKFFIPPSLRGEKLVLLLGRIDDADEVYLNGEFIGRTGRMWHGMQRDEMSQEVWKKLRAYYLPPSLLKTDGENTIAVRVYDVWLHGGIYDEPVGLVRRDKFAEWRESNQTPANFLKRLLRYLW